MGIDGRFSTGLSARGAARSGATWERTLACGCVVAGGGTTGAGGPSIPPPMDRAMCFRGHGMQNVISARLVARPQNGARK